MSSLVKVLSLSTTVACTMGLEPLMFPTGLTEVMVTPPLEPPRLGLDLAPDLVLGLDLCEVLRLLDLPTRAPFFTSRVRCTHISPARSLSCYLERQKPWPVSTRPPDIGQALRWLRKHFSPWSRCG
jgi:hypothetical protein